MIETENAARAWIKDQPGGEAAICRLERFGAMLIEENTKQNLVSASSLDHLWCRHIVDSLQLLLHVPRGTYGSWLDLGSGSGFPGLAIAAFNPHLPMTLVEVRGKRAEWLERAAAELSLPLVRVEGTKLEQVSTGKFDVISARAFAPLARLIEQAARFSTAETIWILPKGKSAREEVLSLSKWHHTFHVEQSLTDADAGIVIGNLVRRKGIQS